MRDLSTHRRSLLKGLTWEIISVIITFLLAWAMFGHAVECILFVTAGFFVKLAFFYLHERAWHQIPYGKRFNHGEEKDEAPAFRP